MAKEELFDISVEAEQEFRSRWTQATGQGFEYLYLDYWNQGIERYGQNIQIQALWFICVTTAYENYPGNDAAKMTQQLGSILSLDAIETEFTYRGETLTYSKDDRAEYHQFTDDFLTDPRWRGLEEVRDGHRFVRPDAIETYMELMRESGGRGPVTSLGPLREIFEEKKRDRLVKLLTECTEQFVGLFDGVPEKELDQLRNIFARGIGHVWAPIAIKYSGHQLATDLLAKRIASPN